MTPEIEARCSAPDTRAAPVSTSLAIEQLVRFYETITPESLESIDKLYAPQAEFRDPFNHVHGVMAIRRIFEHMFLSVDTPQFRVVNTIAQGDQAFLVWVFRFRRSGSKQEWLQIDGGSHVFFDTSGRVMKHRDYWDAAEELYEKFPVLGQLLRLLKRRLRAH